MLNGFRVEQASSIQTWWLSKLVQEEVFVELVKQEEGQNSKAVDNRRNDGVAESYTVVSNRFLLNIYKRTDR